MGKVFVGIATAVVSASMLVGLGSTSNAEAPRNALLSSDWFAGIPGGDLTGIEAAYHRHGGHGPLTWKVDGSTAALSTEKAQSLMDRSDVKSDKASPDFNSNVFSVAVTAITVDGTNDVLVMGTWNFKDTFIGSGGGPDIAAITAHKLSGYCAQVDKTVSHTYDYKYKETHRSSLRQSGVNNLSPVLNVNDGTSGFALATDNGTMGTYYNRTSSRCHAGVQGDFRFEHNQGSGNVTSIGVGWGFLNVGYSGGGEDRYQKSANPTGAHW